MALKISIQANSIVFTDTDTGITYPYNRAFVEPRYTDTQVYFEHLIQQPSSYPFRDSATGQTLKYNFSDVQDVDGDAFATRSELSGYLSGISNITIDQEPEISYAINNIKEQYGDDVSVYNKAKSLLKFGRNTSVGTDITGYTIWATGVDQANETYVASNTNSIDTISSSNSSDTVQVTIEGHTESGGNKTFVVQTVTLNGQNKVTLGTPLNRATRVYNIGSTNLLGNVYVYQNTAISSGKPTDTTKIHLTVRAGKNQSEKASTSISSTDYWIVTGFRGSVLEKTAATADVELQVRQNGGVFRQVEDVACSSSSNGVFDFKPYLVIPPNSDIRLVAVASGASTDVSGSIQGYLAKIY